MFASDLFSIFKKYPEVNIVISYKNEGNMKVNYELKEDVKILNNRKRFLKKIGLTPNMVASAKLGHENRVKIVSEEDLGKFSPGFDGLITNKKNFYLSITAADCLPIFIYDPEHKVIELLHAGWRGLVRGIIPKGIETLKEDFKSKPQKFIVGIGPAIGLCHFEVKDDVLKELSGYKSAIEKRSGKWYVDLKKIAKEQLLKAGVPNDHIKINPLCTYDEKDKFLSFRRDKTDPLEAMFILMGLKS